MFINAVKHLHKFLLFVKNYLILGFAGTFLTLFKCQIGTKGSMLKMCCSFIALSNVIQKFFVVIVEVKNSIDE